MSAQPDFTPKSGASALILDFEQNEFYPHWTAQQLDIHRGYFGNCSTIAVWRRQKLCAVVVYSQFNGVNCEVTVAATSAHWAGKDILKVLMAYPFDQLLCRRLTLLIDSMNTKVIWLAEKIGFKHEGRLRKYMNDGNDCVILSILKEEWES